MPCFRTTDEKSLSLLAFKKTSKHFRNPSTKIHFCIIIVDTIISSLKKWHIATKFEIPPSHQRNHLLYSSQVKRIGVRTSARLLTATMTVIIRSDLSALHM